MAKALELISFEATNPDIGATMLAVSGNSLTLRDSRAPIWLLALWQRRAAAGFTRLTSPLLHDAVVGIQATGPVGVTVQLTNSLQRLYTQDSLTAFGSGSGAAIEQSSILVFYEDLPGVSANLIDRDELMRRGVELYSWQNTLALGTTGGYSGSEALNAEQDQFKANMEYAILGYSVSVPALSLRYVGSDWGNLGLGGPAGIGSDGLMNENWFVELSGKTGGMPCIPVFNSSNKALTTISGITDAGGVDAVVTTMACRLASVGQGKR